ncbi:MAG: hypothetical protein HEQ13_06885 [Dolichospermum sp. DEX189]|nr:hypothetical protein [Dolichospermum sp. DEX189]
MYIEASDAWCFAEELSNKIRFFGTFYGEPSSKSLKALLYRHFIKNIGHNRL